MSMLTLIQHHLRRTGLPYTTAVYGSTDPQVLQGLQLPLEPQKDEQDGGAAAGVVGYEEELLDCP